MLVRQAHEIEYIKKTKLSKSPIEIESKITNFCGNNHYHFWGLLVSGKEL